MTILLPHQKKVVENVVARCQKQKGLFMYHHMGTGKTLTAFFQKTTRLMKYFMRRKKTIEDSQNKIVRSILKNTQYLCANENNNIKCQITTPTKRGNCIL